MQTGHDINIQQQIWDLGEEETADLGWGTYPNVVCDRVLALRPQTPQVAPLPSPSSTILALRSRAAADTELTSAVRVLEVNVCVTEASC